jgi:hypothetical protein
VLRRDAFGVIVDAPEVELRAETREVTRVGRWMGALAAEHRQAAHERVRREGRMDVQIAEQDLLRLRRAVGRHFRRRIGDVPGAGCDHWRGNGLLGDLPGALMLAAAARQQQCRDQQCATRRFHRPVPL